MDGTPTNGVVELRQVLLQRPEAFRTTITEKLLASRNDTVGRHGHAFQRNARDARFGLVRFCAGRRIRDGPI